MHATDNEQTDDGWMDGGRDPDLNEMWVIFALGVTERETELFRTMQRFFKRYVAGNIEHTLILIFISRSTQLFISRSTQLMRGKKFCHTLTEEITRIPVKYGRHQ